MTDYPTCPTCRNQTELSAMSGWFKCVNDNCEFYQDRVVRNQELYEEIEASYS